MDTQALPYVRRGDALLVIDVQNDYLPGGRVPVPGAEQVVPVINEYVRHFQKAGRPVFFTRDWHPPHHRLFRSRHGPMPSHCVAGRPGAAFAGDLFVPGGALHVFKGVNAHDDGCSAFGHTGLELQLRGLGIRRVFVTGVGKDRCVLESVRDALANGFEVVVLEDAIGALDTRAGSGKAAALAEMQRLGAQLAGTHLHA